MWQKKLADVVVLLYIYWLHFFSMVEMVGLGRLVVWIPIGSPKMKGLPLGWKPTGSGQVPSFHMHESCRCCCDSVSKLPLGMDLLGMGDVFWMGEVLGKVFFSWGGKMCWEKVTFFFHVSARDPFFGDVWDFPLGKLRNVPWKLM